MTSLALYWPVLMTGYNRETEEGTTPVEQPLLDILKGQHDDNYGWALACCAWQRSQAEDVLQEAYLRVLDGRARYSGRSAERTWFFGVIKRVAAEQRRGSTRRFILNLRLAREEQPDPGAAANDVDHSLYRDQSARQLQRCLMQLAQRQREVLHLVFYGEMTIEDAALTLGVSLGSARTHYQRGKERLAQLLAKENEHEA